MKISFKGKQFEKDIIIFAIGYYFRFSLSSRDVSELLFDRGIKIYHTTIMRWVHEYGEQIYKIWKYKKNYKSWRLDETYIKIKGKWHYLYRAIDKDGDTLDFYLSNNRDKKSAYKFIKNLLETYGIPEKITTDKAPSIISAIKQLKNIRKYEGIEHRTIKYLNNIIEQDHRFIKKKIPYGTSLQSLPTASATIMGIKTVHAIYKSRNKSNSAFSAYKELNKLTQAA